jgi:hypothetical protein
MIAGFCLTVAGNALWIAVEIVRRFRDVDEAVYSGVYAIAAICYFVGATLADFSLWWRVFFGSLAVAGIWLWWINRRKGRGKKALRQLGAKSKARVDALVRQMTPSPTPSPVAEAALRLHLIQHTESLIPTADGLLRIRRRMYSPSVPDLIARASALVFSALRIRTRKEITDG